MALTAFSSLLPLLRERKAQPTDNTRGTAPGATTGAATPKGPFTPEELRRLGHRPRNGRPITGRAIPREELASHQLGQTNPPDALRDESLSMASSRDAAVRQRRRAIAGNAGRVTAPGGTHARAGGMPRILLGF